MNTVAAVVITRDDARTIERALLSARPYVDELVVVDLGSVDDTLERARACGARVVTQAWSADSATVRNAALAHSGADWNLVLEAGEWIDGGGADVVALRENAPERAGLVQLVPGDAARGLSPVSMQPRLLPRGVQYSGRHRDAPALDAHDVWNTAVVIACDGADAARWRYDRTVSEAAILQALALHPDEPRLLTELAELLRSEGRLAESCELYAAALEVLPEAGERPHALVVEAIDTFRQARRFRDAIALMDAEMPHQSGSPDFSFVIGDLFFEMMLDQPGTSVQVGPLAVTSWRRCIEIGDRPELPGTVNGRGSFLAAQNLATLHLAIGAQEEADHWWAEADRLRSADSLGRPAHLPG